MKRHLIPQLFSLSLVAAVMLAFTPAVMADPGAGKGPKNCPCKHGKMHRGGGAHKGGFFKDLNLTEAQKAQMKQSHETFRKENAAAFDSIKAKRENLRSVVEAKGKDAPEAKALREQLRGEMKALHEKQRGQMDNILTAEQKAKLAAKKAEWKQKREQRKNAPKAG